MLSRRSCLVLPLAALSCSNPADRQEILPMNLGPWKRVAVETIPPEEYQQELRRLGVKRARRGVYQGPIRLTASLYRFGAPAVAFELVQKWRPQRGKLVFQQGDYFVILESEQDDHTSMNSFASVLEGSLGK
ncbi:MAG: hypothetical protein IANPNBLG_00835 [Bryobacteraceae bacterium]|nr:hypothetical protein [Bryobacteraceae bacterium]